MTLTSAISFFDLNLFVDIYHSFKFKYKFSKVEDNVKKQKK